MIPKIIDPDQSGLIPGRQSFYNMRRLFNVLYASHSTQQPEVVFSRDAEKAFDWVEGEYVFTTLDKFGFGPNVISWKKTIYSSPLASVRTSSVASAYFQLYRGTR